MYFLEDYILVVLLINCFAQALLDIEIKGSFPFSSYTSLQFKKTCSIFVLTIEFATILYKMVLLIKL